PAGIMIWVAAIMSMVCSALIAWRVQAWFGPALQRYRQVYTQDAAIKLSEVFLFIDPAQLMAGCNAAGGFGRAGSVGCIGQPGAWCVCRAAGAALASLCGGPATPSAAGSVRAAAARR